MKRACPIKVGRETFVVRSSPAPFCKFYLDEETKTPAARMQCASASTTAKNLLYICENRDSPKGSNFDVHNGELIGEVIYTLADYYHNYFTIVDLSRAMQIIVFRSLSLATHLRGSLPADVSTIHANLYPQAGLSTFVFPAGGSVHEGTPSSSQLPSSDACQNKSLGNG